MYGVYTEKLCSVEIVIYYILFTIKNITFIFVFSNISPNGFERIFSSFYLLRTLAIHRYCVTAQDYMFVYNY